MDWVRVTAGWSVIAPDPASTRAPRFDARDPDAYPKGAWAPLDRLARMARARGLKLDVDIAFWAPRWAVARGGYPGEERDGIAPARYADFAQAVARRYPQAAAFTVWNEPNLGLFFLPQWQREGAGWRPLAPHLYRALLVAAIPRIKAAAPRALALIGGLSSLGTDTPTAADDRMAPLTFLRTLACVDGDLRPLAVPECRGFRPLPGDGFALHPYSVAGPPDRHDAAPDTARLGDLSRLTALLSQFAAAGRTQRALPVYLTEYGYQTDPPDPTQPTSLADQARYLPEAEQLARANPAVRGTAQFLLRDLPERPGPDLATRWRDYQSGLELADGRPKPAEAAYALGLVARRRGPGTVDFWGLVRPGHGLREVSLQVQDGTGWRTLLATRTAADGTFAERVATDPEGTWRLLAEGRAGPSLTGAD